MKTPGQLYSILSTHPKVKLTSHPFNKNTLTSATLPESLYLDSKCPTQSRGLFFSESRIIVIRGYDKFFNVNQTPSLTWEAIKETTEGPFECTVKENGCIIYASAFENNLLVTSKHAIGPHAQKGKLPTNQGKEWLLHHLKSVNKTERDFVAWAQENNTTAVFELVDDDFEEHVLPYPPGTRGLYIHGVNVNCVYLDTWTSDQVQGVATEFGFECVECITFDELDAVTEFTDSFRESGSYKSRPIEGWVIRCKKDGHPFFFKVKYDQPYLLFREWRECTRALLNGVKFTPRYPATTGYMNWVRNTLSRNPELFEGYLKNKGIHAVRDAYFQGLNLDVTLPLLPQLGSLSISDCDQPQKTLLVPVGVPTSGKTSVGIMLSALFGIAHVINDEIPQKKKTAVFHSQIIAAFNTCDTVYADRHNILTEARSELVNAVQSVYPACRIVMIPWILDPDLKIQVAQAIERAKSRKRHQSPVYSGQGDLHRTVSSFVYTFCDPGDGVRVAWSDSVQDVVDAIACKLGLEYTPQEWDKAWTVLQLYYNRQVEKQPSKLKSKIKKEPIRPSPKKEKIKTLRYYALFLTSESRQKLDAALETVLPSLDFYHTLSRCDYHVTLAVNPSLITEPSARNAALFEKCKDLVQGEEFDITTVGVCWNDRVMSVAVEVDIECCNEVPHITIGLVGDAKGKESNDLLKGSVVIDFKLNLKGVVGVRSY